MRFGASIVTVPGEEIRAARAAGLADAATLGSPDGLAQLELEEVATFSPGPSPITSDAEDRSMNKAA